MHTLADIPAVSCGPPAHAGTALDSLQPCPFVHVSALALGHGHVSVHKGTEQQDICQNNTLGDVKQIDKRKCDYLVILKFVSQMLVTPRNLSPSAAPQIEVSFLFLLFLK